MILEKPQTPRMITIDLSGPQGNAFYLLGTAKSLSHQLGLDWEIIHTQMTESDYEWLLQTFDYYFGDLVVMYR